jgi:hypothetical protein
MKLDYRRFPDESADSASIKVPYQEEYPQKIPIMTREEWRILITVVCEILKFLVALYGAYVAYPTRIKEGVVRWDQPWTQFAIQVTTNYI